MSTASVKRIEGFAAIGGEVPYIHPDHLIIVGLDTPANASNWFAECARLNDIPDEDLQDYAASMVASDRVEHIAKGYRDGSAIVLLDGRTTTRAARIARKMQAEQGVPEAQRLTVRVNIIKGEPDELFRANVDSHKHRPLTPLQHAKTVLHYYRRVGEDVTKTASFFRVDPGTVKNALALFDLSPQAQRAIDTDTIARSNARMLAKLPRHKQDEALEAMVTTGSTRGAAAKNAISKIARGEKVTEKDKTRPRTAAFLTKWATVLRKDGFDDFADLIDFVLGKPLRVRDLAETLSQIDEDKKQKDEAKEAAKREAKLKAASERADKKEAKAAEREVKKVAREAKKKAS